ncbi:hypothetical protein DFH08DRAFT_709600 [Mycena albidolilacea]|uniref:Uncharacterized protein n=1 Tax=Mycena albidolilacea TaxID=1033008 RepID=A0AAD6ZLX5_9AGAR|nr:hypothetical protein DFH08DRAFT_709600 [Mycena albidolilacea]
METIAHNSRTQTHPHGVDLLRNKNILSLLGPFDGKVAAWAHIGAQHYFITTNTDYVPAAPSLQLPHAVYLRTDMRYGTDDPTLWPQQWTEQYCHLPLISKKGARPELDVMWWNPGQADFKIGSALTRGLGRLAHAQFSRLLPPINELVVRCKDLRRRSPAIALPLFGELIQQILMWLEQLQTLPMTYPKMLFALTSLQRGFLELDALYNYMTIYKTRMNDYMAPTAAGTAVAQFVGAFTSVPTVAQQLWAAGVPFWFLRPYEVFDTENILAIVPLVEPWDTLALPDPVAHGEGAPPTLYSGNSTRDKISAIHRATRQTPWYHDPFETSFTPACSPSPAPDPATSVACSSRPVVPHCTCFSFDHGFPTNYLIAAGPVANGSRGAAHSNNLQHMHPPKAPPKVPAKGRTKVERDKFAVLAVEGMPPSIVCMAVALAKVDRSVPSTSGGADKRYVLPEPALFVNTTPERRRKFLHHWNLLADGFIYMLTQNTQLLSAQEWRDILEGQVNKHGHPGSRSYRRSEKLEDRIRPALQVSNVDSIEGLPVPIESLPEFSLEQTQEIVWQVAETSFRFEFCSMDRRASRKNRLDEVKACFAGPMLVRVPLEMSKRGWAAATLEERHPYVVRTATLMLDWMTRCPCDRIIGRVAEHFPWSSSQMESLETAVCCYYTQAFWEYVGRAAVIPLRLEHDLEKEDGEL